MAFGDLAIARNLQEYEMMQRSDRALDSLSRIAAGVRAQSQATALAGMSIAASVQSLEYVERTNGFLLGDINLALGVVSDQLADGFAEVAYQQRLQTEQLRGILDTLANPSTVAAQELRDRGLYAYANGWLDDAEKELVAASEKNPFDFTVHQVLGDIAIRDESRLDVAADRFAKAAKYAAPVSKPDAAYAYMSAAKALRLGGRHAEALEASEKAAELAPGLPEVHFAVAQSAMGAGRNDLVRSALHRALTDKPELSVLAAEDAVLAADEPLVVQVLEEVRADLWRRLDDRWNEINPRLANIIDTEETLGRMWRESEAEADQRAAQKKTWSLIRKQDEPIIRWSHLRGVGAAASRAAAFIGSIDAFVEGSSILDFKFALESINRDAGAVVDDAVVAVAEQYLVVPLPADVASMLLDSMLAINPDATRTAECPQCGFRVAELDDYCRSCGVFFKGQLQVPDQLAHAYDAWLADPRHWPTFLARLEGSISVLPSGPGAADRVRARFPQAIGHAGFSEVLQKLR